MALDKHQNIPQNHRNEDNHKTEDSPKTEDHPKKEDDTKKEEYPKNEDDLHSFYPKGKVTLLKIITCRFALF